jgi:hypothetical protein
LRSKLPADSEQPTAGVLEAALHSMFRNLEGKILELRTLHHDVQHNRVMPDKGLTKYNASKKKLLDKLPDLVSRLNLVIAGHAQASGPVKAGAPPLYQLVVLADLKALCHAKSDAASPLTFPWEDVRLQRMTPSAGAWPCMQHPASAAHPCVHAKLTARAAVPAASA